MDSTRDSAIYAKLFPDKLTRGDRTRLSLVRAAIEILGAEGVENLTFEAVGQRVGCNRAQVRYHFPKLEDLVFKAVEYTWASYQEWVVATIQKATTWRERIDAILDGMIDFVEANPREGAVWLYFYSTTVQNPRHRELLRTLEEMGQKRMVGILKEGAEEMGWKPEELATLGRGVWAIIDAFTIYTLVLTRPKGFFRKEARKAIARHLGSV